MRSRNYTKLGITGTLLLLGSIPSIAACTADTAGGSAFTCSGTDTTIQNITTNNASVNVAAGYTNTSGSPIVIKATGALSYTDTNASIIKVSGTGGAAALDINQNGSTVGPGSIIIASNGTLTGGIKATNTSVGKVDIDVTGDVTSTGNAIFVSNSAGTTTDIKTNKISGSYGVHVTHNGTGDVTVTTRDVVTATNTGIYVLNATPTTGGKTIITAQADINAANTGIDAANTGKGTTGLEINATNITTTAPSASGVNNVGIQAMNMGVGDEKITVTGLITATGDGINAQNFGQTSPTGVVSTAKLTITANEIKAGENGIDTDNILSQGDVAITLTGDIVAGSTGILSKDSGKGSNTTIIAKNISANLDGINAQQGDGDLTITANDITSSANNGVSAYTNTLSAGVGGDVNITTTGTVTAGVVGISVKNGYPYGMGSVTINANNVSAGYDGINIDNLGSDTVINTTGTVTGSNQDGIQITQQQAGTAVGNIKVNETSGSITGGVNGINVINEGAGSTTIAVAGVVTGGTGAGINTLDNDTTTSPTDNFTTVTLNSGAVVSATSGVALTNDEGDSLTTVNSGAAVQGKVILGEGNDNLVINGTANVSGATLLDGGDKANSVDLLGSTAYTNKLTFNGTTQSIAGSTMVDWQTVTLDNSNVTFINDAALVTGVGTNTDGSLQGLVLTNASTLTSPIALAVTGDVNIDSTSTLSHALGGSITGNVTNAGMIYWQNLGQTLTITGNYIGNAGNMSLGTDLGDDNSLTDSLVVTGDTSGTTTLTVRPEGTSAGAQTVAGIPVILVGGTSGATFTLASPVQAGAYEYTLGKNDGQNWYLNSYTNPVTPTVTPVTPVTPTVTPTEPSAPIYRPGTSNYVSGQTANAEQGFLALGTLHERMNEQQVVSADKQTWARIYGNTESNNGDSRFNYNQHVRAAQVGQDLYNKTTDNGTNVHSGIMFDYSYSTVDFADRVREDALLDNTTGTMNGTSYGLGGYYTAINGDDSYLDVVGMLSKLENKYKDSYGMKSTQDGYRLGLSVEAGKKLVELGKWKVEGQGQLAYQYTNYDNFNDDISGIDAYGASTLRGRLGVRVYRHLESTKNIQQIDNAQVYGVANVIQDFINPTDVTVGGANVSEKFDKTTLEVGGGFQVPVTGTTYVYTDARYDRSISGNKEQGKLTIGFKTQF